MAVYAPGLPTGAITGWPTTRAPSGWLNCDGSTQSRTTYAALFANIVPLVGTFTVTVATPAVVSLTAHGWSTGDQVFLTTTGALPPGLTANTLYYVIRVDANSFNLATSRANAYAATKIATSGTQSGVHTAWDCPHGLGDGSTTFTLPDGRGRSFYGADTISGTAAGRLTLADALGSYGNAGATGGEQRHTMTTGELVAHLHAISGQVGGVGSTVIGFTDTAGARGPVNSASTGSTTPFNLISPTLVGNYIIKT